VYSLCGPEAAWRLSIRPGEEGIVEIGTSSLSMNEWIDQRPLSAFQICIVILCGVVLTLDGFDAQIMGFLAPSVSDALRIPVKTFGPVFSASLVGLMLAAMASGPIADRWGRKWTVVVSTQTFAIFVLLSAYANSFNQLLAWRFLTGLGLGGAMPNVVSLACEYSPRRLQRTLVAALFVGMPLGGFLCGSVTSTMVPRWGWRSVFYLGGILPLALGLILIVVLPESIRFLSARGADPGKISRILRRISPQLAETEWEGRVSGEGREKGGSVKQLFTEGRAAGTLLLWVPFFMNLLLLYFVISWLPALLRQAGLSVRAGVMATALFSLGGIIGCVAEGPLIRACGASALLVFEFGLCAAFIASLAFVRVSFQLIVPLTFILGFCVIGAQSGINALAASFYPTLIRSTGIGWALGMGRIGSIIGPLLAGAMLSFGWRPQQIFLAGAVPAICACAAVLASKQVAGCANAYAAAVEGGPD
jgi:MFS transporter, AAHS family, 4-hydroxybenzoate transporter